jgi:HlyD family secretion protein
MKKWLIFIVILAVLGSCVYFLTLRAEQRRVEAALKSLQTVSARRGELVAMVGGTGTVRSNQTAYLIWQTSGIVNSVKVRIGDHVQAEDVLADLRPSSLSQSVILAQADLANSQKALEELYDIELKKVQAEQEIVLAQDALKRAQDRVNNLGRPASQADIDVAEASVLLAKIQMDKAWEDYKPYENKAENNPLRAALYNKYAQAKQQYEAAVSRLNNLKGGRPSELNIELAQADLKLAQANLQEAIQQYDRLQAGPDPLELSAIQARITAAQALLDSVRLIAPFEGTITEVKIKPGDQVSPGTVAFRLDDLSRLLLDVPVSEVDISQLHEGQDVLLTFDAISEKQYSGKVVEVARVGNVNQGVVDFNVLVELVDLDELVKPGMTAAVNIIVNRLEDVLLVPNRAVRVKDGKRVVYVLRDGIPTALPIVLGASSEMDSQVVETGLAEEYVLKDGDLIVLNPPENFTFGEEPSFVRAMRRMNNP